MVGMCWERSGTEGGEMIGRLLGDEKTGNVLELESEKHLQKIWELYRRK